jgi:hypothetical protein
MSGKVHVWYMTEEQRLDYIKKHPIIPTERPKGSTFEELKEKKWKWRGKEAARQRMHDRDSIL